MFFPAILLASAEKTKNQKPEEITIKIIKHTINVG